VEPITQKTQNSKPETRNPIKILHLFITLPVGGAEDLLASIVTGLDPARFVAEVACLSEPGPVGEELRRRGQAVFPLGLDIKRDSMFKIVRAVRVFIKKSRPQILHTHLYHPNFYGRLASLGLGLKGVVASIHNAYTRVKFHRCLWNNLLGRFTDRILVSSIQVYQDVRRYDRIPAAKILLMPYGIRMGELDLPLNKAAAKAELGISGFCLGTIGRLEEQKGQEFLLAAIPAIAQQIPDLTVLVVGDGRLRSRLEDQAHTLGIEKIVHFLGTRRELALLYRAMDIFVLPSLWEGLPLVLLKAMAAGLPVLATKVSGAEDIIIDGENGRLLPPRRPDALARAVLELHSRPELMPAWGQQARETISRAYSLEAMLTRLQIMYEELAA
jgi:glycosyltransferase involved in cell wall biosynthesis